LLLEGLKIPVNLIVENVPDYILDRVRQRARLHGRSLQDELPTILEAAHPDERRSTATPGFAEEHQVDYGASPKASQLEEVLEQVRTLPDERQQEVAQVLLAYLDDQDSDFGLSPEQVAKIELRVADDGPYAADEEVRAVFASLTK
jgi:plasmid stability protein